MSKWIVKTETKHFLDRQQLEEFLKEQLQAGWKVLTLDDQGEYIYMIVFKKLINE